MTTKTNKTTPTEPQTTPDAAAEQTAPAVTAQEAPPADRPQADGPISYEEVLEAILFAAGHPVSYEKLAQTFDISASQLREIARKYAKRYNGGSLPRGVMMVLYDDACQLCTKEQYISYIRFALGIRKSGTLSTSSIETLAIVAYHQPVTRAYVDAVRGVDSSYAVTNLLERELIEIRGRMDAPGRPMLYGTTKNFLRCFGLSSLADLPGIENEEIGKVFSTIEQRMAQEQDEPDQISIDDMTGDEAPAEGYTASADGIPENATGSETTDGAQEDTVGSAHATAASGTEAADSATESDLPTADGTPDGQVNVSLSDAPVMRPAAPAREDGIIDLSAEEPYDLPEDDFAEEATEGDLADAPAYFEEDSSDTDEITS